MIFLFFILFIRPLEGLCAFFCTELLFIYRAFHVKLTYSGEASASSSCYIQTALKHSLLIAESVINKQRKDL